MPTTLTVHAAVVEPIPSTTGHLEVCMSSKSADVSVIRIMHRPVSRLGRQAPSPKSAAPRWLLAGLALLLAVTAIPTSAVAQSDVELREENAALRARVRELEAELAAAQARVDELNRRIRDLERTGPPALIPEGTGRLGSPPAPTVTVDESNPSSSPLALLKHIQKQHAEAESGFGSYTAPRERALYLRNLERWTTGMNRRLRTPIEWTVRLDPTRVVHTERAVALRVTAIDPGSGDALGDPFTATLTPTQFRRLEAALRHERGSVDRLLLRGTLVPQVQVNPDRIRAGSFDHPPFIGTFCEFGMMVEGVSLMPEGGDGASDSDGAGR